MQSILIIDDDANYRDTLGQWLDEAGYDIHLAESCEKAFQSPATDEFDLVICDLHLPFTLGEKIFNYAYSYEVGLKTIQELQTVYPKLPIIAVSATCPWDLPKVLKSCQNIPTLSKPFSREILINSVSCSLGQNMSELC